MIKDKVVWGGCVGLFLTGALFAYGFSGEKSESFKIVDLFAIISAVATASAAFAAWSAASAAQKQSFDSAISIRRQTYRMHFESFNEWLDGVESSLNIEFYRRYELYDAIFPDNRNPSLGFSEIGDPELVSWQKAFKSLADLACNPIQPSRRDVATWIGDFASLSGHMHYTFLKADKVQIYLGGHVRSEISAENFKRALPVMGMVLNALTKFSYIEGTSSDRGMSLEFEFAFKEFVDAIMESSWHQHEYKIMPV